VQSNVRSAAAASARSRARTIPPPADHSAPISGHPSGSYLSAAHRRSGYPSGSYPTAARPSGIQPSGASTTSTQRPRNNSDEEPTLTRIPGVAAPRASEPWSRPSQLPRPTRSQEWYVRLKLRQDYVAKLWVRNLTPRDVLVWWSKRQCWAPLLTVPELRQAIVSVEDSAPRQDGAPGREDERASLPEISRATSRGRGMTPSSTRPPPGASDALLYPGGTVSRRPGSSVPPSQARDVHIPRAPRTPSFGPSTGSHPAYAPTTRSQPVRSSFPPSAPAPAMTSVLPPSALVGRAGLSNAERAVWMFAGVAVMIAAVAALRAGRQENAVVATPVMPVVASAPVVAASPPAPASATTSLPQRPEPTSATTSPPQRPEPAEANPPAPRGVGGAARTSARTTPVATNKASGADASDKTARRSSSAARATAPEGFDTSAARRALASAAGRASQCADSGTRGSVVVTFAPSGLVQSASLAQISGENVRQACVLRAFQSAQIAPYVGAPVTVRKSFRLR
jgi:hypothetical protein